MVRVRAFALVFLLSAAITCSPFPAEALEITILPDNRIVSVNSNLIIKVDPEISAAPIRMTWSVYNMGNIGIGSFPVVGGNGVCYFSNTDGNATCGPSPFFQTGETDISVYLVMPGTTTTAINTTVPVNVSALSIPLGGVVRQDNTVFMNIYIAEMGLMKYSIYKEDLGIYQVERTLGYNNVYGRYEGNISLNPGVYYFTFVAANGTSTYGSALKRIEIPSTDFLTIQTDRRDYWKGGVVRISGSSSRPVTGEVTFPGGGKALGFTSNFSSADKTFSYEFQVESSWPDGAYEIRTLQPVARVAVFSVTDLLQVTPASVSLIVDKSDDFTATLSVKNVRQNATTVSIAAAGDLRDSHLTMANKTIAPLQSSAIVIDIPGIQSDVDGAVRITTAEGLEISIPVKVAVREPGQPGECPACAGGKALEIDQDSLMLSAECMAGEETSRFVKLYNRGDSDLSGFSYEVYDSPFSEESLESLDAGGGIGVPLDGFAIHAGDSGEIEVNLTPQAGGKYEGTLSIRSGGEEGLVAISLRCFEDISGELSALSSRLEGVSTDVSSGIRSDIRDAEDALAVGSYAKANEYLARADAKVSMIGPRGGPAAPADFTWVIIVVILAVVGGVFFFFFRMRKPKAGEEGAEELESFG